MITVITVTIGRQLYLQRNFDSIKQMGGDVPIHHVVIFNGIKPHYDMDFHDKTIVHLPEPLILNQVLNKAKEYIQGDIVMKMDDDCILRSPDFFKHVEALHELEPSITFSPYPVGLIGNPGGVMSSDRRVVYSKDTDTFYTLRKVNHVGGFARICPADYATTMEFVGTDNNEDGQFSDRFRGMGMYYLENALIVEHQESTLGQHSRYGEAYFKGRF